MMSLAADFTMSIGGVVKRITAVQKLKIAEESFGKLVGSTVISSMTLPVEIGYRFVWAAAG